MGSAEDVHADAQGPKQREPVNQIDHLNVTAPLCKSIVSCGIGDWARLVGRGLSDHVPIVADFGDGGLAA